ncbi:MAG TPA: response regulator [Rhodospirillales bacterium]|nr:response regulator [Rhodospirillales bacterium]
MAKKTYCLERIKFLIVEDNKHMRCLINNVLVALGAVHIMEAEDGADALKALRDFQADIIICDWNMAPMDGIKFTRAMRNSIDSPNPYAPIIMLTGHSGKDRVVEARDAGVHEFVAKPFSAKSIYSRIRAIIERPRVFIRTVGESAYFGPDRRRKNLSEFSGQERRKEAQDFPGFDVDLDLD